MSLTTMARELEQLRQTLQGIQVQTAPAPADPQEPEPVRRARSNLLDFAQYVFPDYEANWHHRVLCRYLDRLVAGALTRLMVFMPPRHGKSTCVSRALPAYYLGLNPNAEIIACSYASSLASRMNRDVQRILDGPAYQRLFPETRLWGKNVRTVAFGTYLRNSDLFEVVNYKGAYRSAGVQAGITGAGFQLGIIDDPFADAAAAASPTVRDNVYEWYCSTFQTRKAKGARILITQTRWHEDDLCGRLLKLQGQDPRADQWTVVSFPAVCEHTDNPDDPREVGEALWPSWFPREDLEKVRATSSYYWAALYQQSPRVRAGGFFQGAWFPVIDHVPPNTPLRLVRAWDLAGTAPARGSDPDWTVGVLMGRAADGAVYVLDVRRFRGSPGDVEQLVRQTALADGKATAVVMEEEPGSAGKAQVFHYRTRVLPGHIFYGVRSTGAKELRAEAFSSYAQGGHVRLLRGNWVGPYLEVLEGFPRGAHDDDVDASSLAFSRLTDGARATAAPAVADPGPQLPRAPLPGLDADAPSPRSAAGWRAWQGGGGGGGAPVAIANSGGFRGFGG